MVSPINLDKKTLFMAQLIKYAGRLESETKLAKMLCYVEKERGIKTNFNFDKDQKHGHYTHEIKEEHKKLEASGLIEFIKENKINMWNKPYTLHVFISTEKLKHMDLPLNEKEKKAVLSIYREYNGYSPKEIENYDHAVYRYGKTRTNVDKKNKNLEDTKKLLLKHDGNEITALEEWLFG